MRIARVAVFACAVFTVCGPPVDAATKPPRPVGVNWGGYHFTGQHSLESWLARRGVDYGDWARSHPRGVYLLTHRAPRKRPVKPETPIITAPPTTPATSPPARTAAPRANKGHSFTAVETLLALAFLSLAVAVAPAKLMRHVFGDATTHARTLGFAVAGAIGLGLAVVYTL